MICPKCSAQIPDDAKSCVMCGAVIGSQPVEPQPVSSVEIDTKRRAATQWLRLVNYFIDGIACGMFGAFLNAMFVTSTKSVLDASGNLTGSPAQLGVSMALPFFYVAIYYTFFEAIWQRTPGKWASGTKVVALDGSKPSLGRIIGRSFARYIPFEPFSYLFGKHPYGWHDSLSKTIVVPATYSPEDVRAIDVSDKGKGSVWLATLAILSIAIPLAIFIGLIATMTTGL